MTQETLGRLSKESRKAIEKMGFEELSPIQQQAIPPLLDGRDLIGQAQTGTGKTAAFCLPLIEKLDPTLTRPQAMILCPTRELSVQVAEELGRLAKYHKRIQVLPVYGGAPIDRQIRALRAGVHVVVGTPGRVMDHMRRRTLKLDDIRYFVLDEADEMFAMGFREDMAEVIEALPENVQKAFFSATMAQDIRRFAERYLENPEYVQLVRSEMTVPRVEQHWYELQEYMKPEILTRLVDVYDPRLCIVFCNTKKKTDELASTLAGRGYAVGALHGDLKQSQRDAVMGQFKRGQIEILVATDVAARGLDVDDIDLVINYDMPQDEEYYVHRIGRTARAGRDGKAVSLIAGKDIYKLRDIRRYTKADIDRKELPTLSDMRDHSSQRLIQRLRSTMEEGEKNEPLVDLLISEGFNSYDIACAALAYSRALAPAMQHDELAIVDDPEARERHRREREKKRDGKKRDGGKGKNKGMRFVRLQLDAGKEAHISQRHIVAALIENAEIQAGAIGRIDLYPNHSFVDVAAHEADRVLRAMRDAKLRGKIVRWERARPRRPQHKRA